MKKCTNKKIGRLIGLYEFGGLAESDLALFCDHLVECEYCYDQVYSMEPFAKAFREHRDSERITGPRHTPAVAERGPKPRLWGWSLTTVGLGAACLVLGACVLAALLYAGGWIPGRKPGTLGGNKMAAEGSPSPFERLEIPKAPYDRSSGKVVMRVPNRTFDGAMAAYQANDFSKAIEQLRTLSELDPDAAAEARFYLGVSLLLAGRSQEAIFPLMQASQSQAGAEREASLYYLALAYLKTNQLQQAGTELKAVVQADGAHKPSAQKLIDQLGETARQ
jgi:hypothetical protein